MRFKFNRQDGIKDCGVCCLHNIIRYYNGNINFEKLRIMTNTNLSGTSVFDIVKAANNVGLKSKSYKCNFNHIYSIKLPIIVHIKVELKYSHFVIVKKIENNQIFLFDPIRGNIRYSKKLFLKEWNGIVITFDKTKKLVNEKGEYKSYLFNQIKSNKKKLLLISTLSLICTLIYTLNSFYIKKIIDDINNNKNNFLFFLTFSIIYAAINYIKNNIIINFNSRFDSKLTDDIYNHILYLPLSYHHNRPAGDVVSRVYDLYFIKDFINQLSYSIIVDVIFFVIINIFLFLINKLLFLILLFIFMMYICVYIIFRDKINNLVLINQENQSKVNSGLVENLLGIDTIKNMNLEEIFKSKQNNLYYSYLNKNKKLNKIINIYETIQELIQSIGIIAILFIGSYLILNKVISIGSLVVFNTLMLNLFATTKRLINSDNTIINSKNAYKRINELFNIEEEKQIASNKTFKNQIEIKNLTFDYNNLNILNNFNLVINKNDYILITGKSGIGKSTIFKLLTKQIKCNPNMILLDNISLDNFSNQYIKNKICYVSQNEFIFTDTIKNNIILYNNVQKKDFNKVLKITMIDKMLKDKNIDIDYLLEENGHNLSGGERQKIIIARALLSNRNLIIFDETMNEIDIESERKIIKNIKAEYNKTIILISHRLSSKDLFNKYVRL